jgi:hypothetical protein
MKIPRILLAAFSITAISTIFVCCDKDDDSPPAANAYAVGSSNSLLAFNTGKPASVTAKAITGLTTGDQIEGLDFRPANGELYAISQTGRLYKINTGTGAATLVTSVPSLPLLSGSSFGVDFNPMADRIRVVSNTRHNMRINPESGAVAGIDTDINPNTTGITAVAYTNNKTGAASTDLYYIDPVTDNLYKASGSPNGGLVVAVGPLGLNIDGHAGFDIAGTDNKAFAILSAGGTAKFYSINLSTGAATAVGDFASPAKGLALSLSL